MELAKTQHISHIPKDESLPRGVKIIAWARTIRWIGWGFGEALIPIFIFSFSSTFAEAGLFRSTYEIATLLALPIIGAWADRTSAKYLIIVALLLYPLVGVSYFLAGFFGAAIFIIIARGLNGTLWGMENIGVSTYYRRLANHNNLGSSFGYIETWSNFGWIIAALIGMYLVSFVPIHYLLLAISPAAVVALFVALRAPRDISRNGNAKSDSLVSSYRKAFSEWKSWNNHLWLLGALVIFSGIIEALMWFFIPIDAYIDGAKPAMVVLLVVIAAIPTLFGYTLGKIADKRNKYFLIAIGLLGVAVIMIGLAIFPQYAFKLIASFALGVLLELFAVIQKILVTTLGPAETYGQRGSAFESVATLGDLSAPLILGVALDVAGFTNVSFIIASVAVILCISYALVKNRRA